MTQQDGLPVFCAAKNWLDRYFAGENPAIDALPLRPIGSEFRQEVWSILCQIPYGEVTTYGCIAKKLAAKRGEKTMSSQAVGGAVGHNPFPSSSLPSGGGRQWKPDGLHRGNWEKDQAVKSGGRGYVASVCADEGDGSIGIYMS